jgi:hypothetical protein
VTFSVNSSSFAPSTPVFTPTKSDNQKAESSETIPLSRHDRIVSSMQADLNRVNALLTSQFEYVRTLEKSNMDLNEELKALKGMSQPQGMPIPPPTPVEFREEDRN